MLIPLSNVTGMCAAQIHNRASRRSDFSTRSPRYAARPTQEAP